MPNCTNLFLSKEELQFHIDCRHKSIDEDDLFCTEVPDIYEEEEIMPTYENIYKKNSNKFTRLQEVAIQVYSELDMERKCLSSIKKYIPFETGCLKRIVSIDKNMDIENNKKENVSPKRKLNETIPSDLLLMFLGRKPKCSKTIEICKTGNSTIFNIKSILSDDECFKNISRSDILKNQQLPSKEESFKVTLKSCTLSDHTSKKMSNSAVKLFVDSCDININEKQKTLKNINMKNISKNRKYLSDSFDDDKNVDNNYCERVFKIASNFILKLSTSPEKLFNAKDNYRIIF
uniref:C2H2-type domain-containing protein n=1 Tax=Parastrongyloides trichosuri TaxID=131310 RepID=A0A0N4ZRR3_PARTI